MRYLSCLDLMILTNTKHGHTLSFYLDKLYMKTSLGGAVPSSDQLKLATH